MRSFLPIALLLLGLVSSIAFGQKLITPPPLRTPSSLHPIPLHYTGNLPDIFLPGDSVGIPHVRTHILEFTSTVTDNNYLIEGIKQQGMQEGVDGILLTDYRKLIPGETTMLGTLNGIGLKYLSRINYLDTILKQKVISTFDPGGNPGKTIILDIDWYGRLLNPLSQEDKRFYADSMAMMDLNVMFNRSMDIYTYKDFGSPQVLKIVSNESLPARIVHEVTGNVWAIDFFLGSITPLGDESKKTKVKISPVYTGNLLTGAIVTKLNKDQSPLYYLHYKYDNLGRLTNERWEKLINGKRTLWLEVENRFFEINEELFRQLGITTGK
jgi:hypothetical protein